MSEANSEQWHRAAVFVYDPSLSNAETANLRQATKSHETRREEVADCGDGKCLALFTMHPFRTTQSHSLAHASLTLSQSLSSGYSPASLSLLSCSLTHAPFCFMVINYGTRLWAFASNLWHFMAGFVSRLQSTAFTGCLVAEVGTAVLCLQPANWRQLSLSFSLSLYLSLSPLKASFVNWIPAAL